MRSRAISTLLLSLVITLSVSLQSGRCDESALAVKTGQKIAFLGDSITAQGAGSPSGYVNLVINGLQQQGLKLTAIPAGVSGNTSNDMLARLDRDVISKKPDWMTLSCGVNDVWHGVHGVELELYKKNITAIVDKAQAAGIKVIILTATMIQEVQSNSGNQKLIAYNDFLRSLASERKLLFVDLNADMQAAIKTEMGKGATPGGLFTIDGVHPNALGHELMAAGILKAFGTSDAKLDQIRTAWLDMPDAAEVKVKMTARQYLQLREMAETAKRPMEEIAGSAVIKTLSAPSAPQPVSAR